MGYSERYGYTDAKGVSHSFNSLQEMEDHINKEAAEAKSKEFERKSAWIPSSADVLVVRPRYAVDKTRGKRSYIKLISSLTAGELLKRTSERNSVVKAGNGGGASLSQEVTWKRLKEGTFAHFILDSARSSLSEKTQVVQTFGDAEVIYHFGRTPIVYSISGTLLDDADNQWFSEFLSLYATTLRGTQLARNQELVEIGLPNVTIQGTITDFSYGQQASSDTMIQFSLSIVVRDMALNPVSLNFTENDRFEVLKAFDLGEGEDDTIPTVTQSDIKGALSAGEITAYLNPDGTLIRLPVAHDGPVREVSASELLDDEEVKPAAAAAINTTPVENAIDRTKNFLINNVFSPVYGLVTNIVKVATQISDTIEATVKALVAPVKKMINAVKEAVKKVLTKLKSAINEIRSKIKEIKAKIKAIRQMIQNVKNAIGAIKSFAEDVKAKLKLLKAQAKAQAGISNKRKKKYRPKLEAEAAL